MPSSDLAYLAHVASRLVRMFERYAQNIDPNDEQFLTYVSERLKEKGLTDPKSVPYLELYKQVKDAIREYLRQDQGPSN